MHVEDVVTDDTHELLQGKLRTIKAAPFCWQHKSARRKIRDAFDRAKTVHSALGVYDALTEIASDEESEVFETTHAHISQKSGWSPRTVQDRLPELEEIGLVVIQTPALKAPSTIRLLAITDKQPLPNVQQRTKRGALPTVEQQQKKEEQSESLRGLALKNPQLSELMAKVREVLGPKEFGLNHRRWIERAQSDPDKLDRVLNDTRTKAREDGLDNRAAWAETMWGKVFK